MTTHNGIETPCFGSLVEIHAALIGPLNWTGNTVTINDRGYTVMPEGFKSHYDGIAPRAVDRVFLPSEEAFCNFLHKGMAILIGLKETGYLGNYGGEDPDYFQIVTVGELPHVSKRCALCGVQLCEEEIGRGACNSCYAEEVGS